MRIIVKAKTKAKIAKVERVSQPSLDLNIKKEVNQKMEEPVIYKVSVKEAPIQGKANEAVIKALAEYFDVAPSRIQLISGQTSKQKIFDLS